jgi:uncharacterized membrane protein YoaT (DUF817 family)
MEKQIIKLNINLIEINPFFNKNFEIAVKRYFEKLGYIVDKTKLGSFYYPTEHLNWVKGVPDPITDR